MREVATEFGWTLLEQHSDSDSQQQIPQWNLQWYDFYIQEDEVRKMLPYQRINHFPGSAILGKKNNLSKYLSKMRKVFPEEYDFYPRSFLLPYHYEELR